MTNYPEVLIRPSDKERFTRNTDGTYSNARSVEQYPKHMHHTWSQKGSTLKDNL